MTVTLKQTLTPLSLRFDFCLLIFLSIFFREPVDPHKFAAFLKLIFVLFNETGPERPK